MPVFFGVDYNVPLEVFMSLLLPVELLSLDFHEADSELRFA